MEPDRLTADDDDSARLDGSPEAARRALAELATLAGQDGPGAPLLELWVDDIVARAALDCAEAGGQAFLVVSARLPGGPRAADGPVPAAGLPPVSDQCDYLWLADEGCHAVLRRIPLATLGSERQLMDAILATIDAARAWQAALASGTPSSRG